MNKMFTCTFYTPQGRKETRTSPFLPSEASAFCWLMKLKPWVLKDILNVDIRPWARGDSR